MSTALTADARRTVLDAVYQAVARECPGCFAEDVRQHAGGIDMIAPNLDMLVEIVRRSTARRIEPFQVQIMWEICEACPYQFRSGYCPLRQTKLCVLYQHAAPVIEAISTALLAVGDAPFLKTHPAGGGVFRRAW